jgi:hypothetical protein
MMSAADIPDRQIDVCFTSKADIRSCERYVARGQKRTSTRLFNDLICRVQKALRHSEIERLGGLEIDDQFVFGRRLHR